MAGATNRRGGGGGSGITSLTGDVTGTGPGATAATIANDAVTYAKIQNVSATSRVLGRITAGAGDVEELTGANVATISGAMTSLTGDVTATGPGASASTIANDAVTYAKMQNVSATSRILGRATAGAGDVEELTGAQVATIIGGVSREISALQIGVSPDDSGNCWQERASVLLTTAPWGNLIFRFGASNAAQPTTRIGLFWSFVVPEDYVGGATFEIHNTLTGTSGNIVWDVDYRAVGGDDTTSLNQAGVQEALTLTDAAPTTGGNRLTPSVAATAGNFTAGATISGAIYRDGTDGSDTAAFSSILFDLRFRYTN